MTPDDGQQPPNEPTGQPGEPERKGDSGQPEYRVYRSRGGMRSRLPSADLSSLREKAGSKIGSRGPKKGSSRPKRASAGSGGRGPQGWKRWAMWAGIFAIFWVSVSFVSFMISATIQSSKLADSASAALSGGGSFPLVKPTTILVLGTDARDPDTKEPGAPTKNCFEQQSRGEAPHGSCSEGEFRADTLLLVRAGGGTFRKLSIPRDSYAEVPGHDPQKINGAFAFGGAGLQVKTVENFLDIDVDHVVMVNFTGFQDFIDAIGGVKIDLPHKLCADIAGGAGGGQGGISLRLKKGENTLDGEKALAYSRVRKLSPCPGKGKSEIAFGEYDDLDRAAAQQRVLNGIKSRLTSPFRLPYNFIKGPIIGWQAPKAFVSDMGGFSMIQLMFSSVISGSGKTDVICAPRPDGGIPCGAGPDGSIEVPEAERQRAVNQFLG